MGGVSTYVEPSKVFTLLTNKIDFTGKFEISDKFTIKIFIDDFKFNIERIIESNIGEIEIKIFQVLINIMNDFFKKLINKFMKNGLELEWLLKYFNLDFISLEKTKLLFRD